MKKILTVITAIILAATLGCVVCLAAETGETSEAEAVGENVFATLFAWLAAHASEVLSALTLAGSLLLTFTYKRGLLPKFSSALGSIGASIGSFGDSAGATLASLDERFGGVSERVEAMASICNALSSEVGELSARLAASENGNGEQEKLRLIIGSQVDMLYEIFISSSLPQYAKEAVGEKIAAMRAALGDGERTDG